MSEEQLMRVAEVLTILMTELRPDALQQFPWDTSGLSMALVIIDPNGATAIMSDGTETAADFVRVVSKWWTEKKNAARPASPLLS